MLDNYLMKMKCIKDRDPLNVSLQGTMTFLIVVLYKFHGKEHTKSGVLMNWDMDFHVSPVE